MPDVTKCEVTNLCGRRFIDKTDAMKEKREERTAVTVEKFTDSIYKDTPNKYSKSLPNGVDSASRIVEHSFSETC